MTAAENYQVPKLTLDEAMELRSLVRQRRAEVEAGIRRLYADRQPADRHDDTLEAEHNVLASLVLKL